MKTLRCFNLLIALAMISFGATSSSAGDAIPSGILGAPTGIDTADLCRHWVHSVEEQTRTQKAQIYRPANFKQFPPSRFRMQYIFHTNGECEWYYLSPDDAHRFKSGKWRIDSNKNLLQIVKRDSMESYRILELTKEILRIVPIRQTASISKITGVRKETYMTTSASGTFDVKTAPQAPDEKAGSSTIGRLLLDKQFHGDLEGTSKGQMLAFSSSSVKGSAGYVAIEEVTGTLNGRAGTFALQHSGTMTRGTPHLTITVVPDSGTGQLTGLTGKMVIEIAEGKHSYKFDYSID